MQSRSAVSKKIGLTDKDLSNVLPIHPYAALILQHISIYYTSTARSMFNFIKNDEGEDVKAFQWFIDRYDFSSQNPFVTIDMLWNFFYETGSQKLADGIREVLSCYTQKMDKELMEDEKRVLKVILLLQAISERMSGNRDIFLPNNKNLTLAFEGTDLEFTAQNIAKKLLNDHVVTRTPLTGDVFSYCCKNMGPSVDPGPFIAQAKGKSTKDMSFMAGSNLRTTIEFTGALKLRYSLAYATLSDFDSEIKKANNPSATNNKLYAVATIGRDSAESGALKKKIENFFVNNPESNAIVIDSSTCVLGEGEYNEFVENYAMSLAIGNSDLDQRKTYEGYAIEVLSNWAKRIKCGDFYVYSRPTRIATVSIGYGDGYPRGLSNKGRVLIGSQSWPIIGRVCMDQLMVDVTDADYEIKQGDEVVLVGSQGSENISVEEVAAINNSFNYEFVCDINRRVPRVYYRDGEVVDIVNYLRS